MPLSKKEYVSVNYSILDMMERIDWALNISDQRAIHTSQQVKGFLRHIPCFLKSKKFLRGETCERHLCSI